MTCGTCKGSGYEKRDMLICSNCNGTSCYQCKNGLKVEPYETCRTCLGCGT